MNIFKKLFKWPEHVKSIEESEQKRQEIERKSEEIAVKVSRLRSEIELIGLRNIRE